MKHNLIFTSLYQLCQSLGSFGFHSIPVVSFTYLSTAGGQSLIHIALADTGINLDESIRRWCYLSPCHSFQKCHTGEKLVQATGYPMLHRLLL